MTIYTALHITYSVTLALTTYYSIHTILVTHLYQMDTSMTVTNHPIDQLSEIFPWWTTDELQIFFWGRGFQCIDCEKHDHRCHVWCGDPNKCMFGSCCCTVNTNNLLDVDPLFEEECDCKCHGFDTFIPFWGERQVKKEDRANAKSQFRTLLTARYDPFRHETSTLANLHDIVFDYLYPFRQGYITLSDTLTQERHYIVSKRPDLEGRLLQLIKHVRESNINDTFFLYQKTYCTSAC